jgi:hypothetical protein
MATADQEAIPKEKEPHLTHVGKQGRRDVQYPMLCFQRKYLYEAAMNITTSKKGVIAALFPYACHHLVFTCHGIEPRYHQSVSRAIIDYGAYGECPISMLRWKLVPYSASTLVSCSTHRYSGFTDHHLTDEIECPHYHGSAR